MDFGYREYCNPNGSAIRTFLFVQYHCVRGSGVRAGVAAVVFLSGVRGLFHTLC